MNEWISLYIGWMNERMNRWMNEWISLYIGRMNERMNRWMNEWISLYIRWFPNYPCFIHILQLIIEIWSSPLDGGYIKMIKPPPPLPRITLTPSNIKLYYKIKWKKFWKSNFIFFCIFWWLHSGRWNRGDIV